MHQRTSVNATGLRGEKTPTSGDAALALKGWLAGQAIGMLLVGAFTGLGLWLVGVPSALALGFLPASLFAPLGPL